MNEKAHDLALPATHLRHGFRQLQMHRSAIFSACHRYRYQLSRRWSEGPCVTFIMLNPSTADAKKDDPTIRRCIGFAQREGFGGLDVVNLFAGRATRPEDLFAMPDPIGPENHRYLSEMTKTNGLVIAAWGAHPKAQQAFSELRQNVRLPKMMCLGMSKAGSPRHPLYLPKDQRIAYWPA